MTRVNIVERAGGQVTFVDSHFVRVKPNAMYAVDFLKTVNRENVILLREGIDLVLKVDEQTVVRFQHFYHKEASALFSSNGRVDVQAQIVAQSSAASIEKGTNWQASVGDDESNVSSGGLSAASVLTGLGAASGGGAGSRSTNIIGDQQADPLEIQTTVTFAEHPESEKNSGVAARQLATDASEIEPSIVSTAVGGQVDSSQSPNGAMLRGSSLDFDDAIKIEMISTQVASIDPVITICPTSIEVPEEGGWAITTCIISQAPTICPTYLAPLGELIEVPAMRPSGVPECGLTLCVLPEFYSTV